MKVKTYVAGLGLAAKVMLGAGVAAAATTGAGAAGVLPDAVQHAFATTVDSVTPFNLPDPADEHAAQATGDHADEHSGDHPSNDPTSPTTSTDQSGDDNEHDTPVIVEPTTTTTVAHHEDHHDDPTTPTTVANHEGDHHEPATTSTTEVEHHDGDNNNPESLSLSCEPAHEPDRIICHWTASTSPEHRRYALLQTNNVNDQGRVAFQTESQLEYADTYVTRTATFTYRVVSLREDGTVESHSNAVSVTCC